MVIDRASIFADRFKGNPQILQAAVLGQSPVPGLDPYTALRAMQLLKESQQMQMAQAAQQPTNTPSLVQMAMQMPQMPPQMARPAPQQAAPQQAPMMAASGGLAALPSGSHDYALGGIVSFNGEGEEGQLVVEPSSGGGGDEEGNSSLLAALQAMEASPGDPGVYRQLTALYPGLIREALKDAPPGMTATERAQFVKDYIAERRAEAGPSPFGGLREEIATARGERDKNLRQAQGIALLEASAEALRPGGTMRGLAGAAAKFGGSYGQALQADRAERRALANMEMNIADAERKERMGLHSEARAAAAAADKDKVEAGRARSAKFNSLANLVGRGIQATKPTTPKPPTPPKFNEIAYQVNLDNLLATQKPKEGETAAQFNARMRATAVDITAKQIKTTDTGPVKAGLTTAAIFQRIDANVSKSMRAFDEDPRVAGDLGFQYQQLISKARKAEKVNNLVDANKFRTEAQALRDQYQTQQRALEAQSMMEESEQSNAANPAPAARGARPAPPAGFVADPNR